MLEKDCEAMKTELCAKNLRKRFAVEEDFHFTFETIPNELGQTCFQAHAVRECGDELIKKDREYKEKLDQAYRLVRKQLDIIRCQNDPDLCNDCQCFH